MTYAKNMDIDFIVCVHHLPDAELPPAVAILNPKQSDCNYPYKELCGCGIGFKLMQALAEQFNLPNDSYLQYIDLVATAIGADIVPITAENRVLVFYGLKKVNENPCTGIKALLHLAAFKKIVCVNDLVFIIAPRINAAGRMDDARKVIQLFIEPDYIKALEFAEMLHHDNTDRKTADSSITDEALYIITNNEAHKLRKTTVVYQQHWHKGVVGIVASRLIENYYRPTVVLTKSGDVVSGSARSVPGFNLYEAIHACRDSLVGYGGHFAAAGLTLLEENVSTFSEQFENFVASTINPELLIPEIIIDAEINFNILNKNFYSIIHQMEPFGPQNMRPVFLTRRAAETGYSRIVKNNHIRFVLKQSGCIFTGIGFNMAEKFHLLQMPEPLDIVYTIDLNEWNGEQTLQLKVCDIRLSEKPTALS
ncbi:MAG: DHHA1 domain-containing protein [Parafilimonas sp.]